MVEEQNTGAAAPAAATPKPNESTAPLSAVTETAPAAVPSPEPSTLVSAPSVAEPAPAPEAAPTDPAPASAASTILGTEPPKVAPTPAPAPASPEIKPAEGEKPADKPKEEGNQSADPAPLPTYEPFTLPEGIQVDDKRLGEFTKELAEFEVSNKVEHTKVQEFAQRLVNRYVAETQDTVKRIGEYYTNTWEKQKNDWREAFIADPELGGNRQETTATAVQNFVGEFGGSGEGQAKEQQITELRSFMDTGIGNNPLLIRLMNNAAGEIKALRMKYESEEGVRPLPGQKPVTEKKSKTQTLYGRSSAS